MKVLITIVEHPKQRQVPWRKIVFEPLRFLHARYNAKTEFSNVSAFECVFVYKNAFSMRTKGISVDRVSVRINAELLFTAVSSCAFVQSFMKSHTFYFASVLFWYNTFFFSPWPKHPIQSNCDLHLFIFTKLVEVWLKARVLLPFRPMFKVCRFWESRIRQQYWFVVRHIIPLWMNTGPCPLLSVCGGSAGPSYTGIAVYNYIHHPPSHPLESLIVMVAYHQKCLWSVSLLSLVGVNRGFSFP